MMYFGINGNLFKITDENGEVLLTIELTDESGHQVIIKTAKEVYAGPIELLEFSSDS